jgi:hypothetical protein
MNINQLRESLAQQIHDIGMEQANARQLLIFINAARDDAAQRGWLIPIEEDETIVLDDSTYEYPVPADFYIVCALYQETDTAGVFDGIILPHEWRLGFDGYDANIIFNRTFADIINNGAALKVVGYKRPTKYVEGLPPQAIDPGIESFLRERATAQGARYMKEINPDQATQYTSLAQEAYATSEAIMVSQLQIQDRDLRKFEIRRIAPGR